MARAVAERAAAMIACPPSISVQMTISSSLSIFAAVEVLIHGVRRKAGTDVIRNAHGLGWRVAGAQS